MLYTIYPFASNNITKVKMMNRGLQSPYDQVLCGLLASDLRHRLSFGRLQGFSKHATVSPRGCIDHLCRQTTQLLFYLQLTLKSY